MKTWALWSNDGVVLELFTLDDNIVPGTNLFTPAMAANMTDVSNVTGIAVGWVRDGSTISAPPPLPPPSLTEQAVLLGNAAAAQCSSIIAIVCPDQPHLIAVQNGFAAVMGNNGQAPTIEPVATMFANNAAMYGKSVTDFVPMVIALGAASMEISTALGTLQNSVSHAMTASDLSNAQDAFNNSMIGIVAAIQSQGITINLTPIAIEGLT